MGWKEEKEDICDSVATASWELKVSEEETCDKQPHRQVGLALCRRRARRMENFRNINSS